MRNRLSKCKDCGAEVSRRAGACPKCGRRFGRLETSTLMFLVFVGVVALILAFYFFGPPPS